MSYIDDLRKKREEEQRIQPVKIEETKQEQPQTTSYIQQLRTRNQAPTPAPVPAAVPVTQPGKAPEPKKPGLLERVSNFFKENPTPVAFIQNITKPKTKPGAMVFKVGEGMTPAQTEKAKEVIAKPVFSAPILGGADITIYGFANSFLPIKLLTVGLEKVGIESPNKTRWELAKEQRPLEVAIGSFAGDLANLWLLGQASVGLKGEAVANKALGGTKYLLPNYLQKAIPKAVGLGTIFATNNFLTETLDQIQAGKIQIGKLAGETAKGFGLGTVMGGATAGTKAVPRVIGAVGSTATFQTTTKLIEKGKLDTQDVYDVAVNSLVNGVFEALAGKYPGYKREQDRINEFSREMTVNRIMSNGKTRKEAESITDTLSQLEAMQFGIKGSLTDTRLVQVLDNVPESFTQAPNATKSKYVAEVMKQLDKGVSVNESLDIANKAYGFGIQVNTQDPVAIETPIAEHIDTAQQDKAQFEQNNQETVIELKQPGGIPMETPVPLQIHTVEYGKGAFSVDVRSTIGGESLQIPFGTQVFDTRQAATDAGIKAAQDFTNQQEKNATSPAISEELKAVRTAIDQFTQTKKPIVSLTREEVKPKREKPIVVERITLTSPDVDSAKAEFEAQVLERLSVAEGGKRFFTRDEEGYIDKIIGQPTSIPDFIPEELRKTKLFAPVLKHIYSNTTPTKADEVRLYNFIADYIAARDEAKTELDQELGTDIDKLFEGDTVKVDQAIKKTINELQTYEQTKPGAGVEGEAPTAPQSQKEAVKEAVRAQPKNIKQITEETKILEPNVRRILGVGAKEGTFERVDKGVYVLSRNGQDIAYVHTGDAVETLPKLAADGFKADMIFLDIPYKTPAVTGGNRGVKFDTISPEQFDVVSKAIATISRTKDTPVFYMYSQARSGLVEMQRYTDLILGAGFVPVARGEYTKTQLDGITQVRNMRGDVIEPEGLILLSQSGKLDATIKPVKDQDLQFKLVRPRGYQTEKPAAMLKKLIELTTKEGDVVLDPFAGSGVTGEQAIKAGRKTVLIEKSAKAVEGHIKPKLKMATTKTFYRGGGGGAAPKGKTAQDILNYEIRELGNADIVVEPGIDLKNIPSNRTQWLTTTRKAAEKYGEVEEVTLIDYRIIARDNEGGVLVEVQPENEIQKQADVIAKATIGTGNFLPGEVYQQLVGGNRTRPVILTQKNADGSVEGFYLGAGFKNEREFGMTANTLIPAKWMKPATELEVPTFTQERLNDFIDKVFNVPSPKEVEHIGGGGGQAARGLFIDNVETEVGHLKDIYPIEIPELVDFTRELMGAVPTVSKSAGGRALGRFYGDKMKIRADLFDRPEQVSMVLAHEIGHLVDFLPEHAQRGGNIIGRLASVNDFMRGTFSTEANEKKIDVLIDQLKGFQNIRRGLKVNGEVTDKKYDSTLRQNIITLNKQIDRLQEGSMKDAEIHTELMAVTRYWHPWDETKAPDSYNQYRKKASELYADALSMLLNSPGTLERMANKFYTNFFKNLDKKPDVKAAYFELQALMSGDRSALVERRREGVRQMFDTGDYMAKDLQEQRAKERKDRSRKIWQRLKFDQVSRNFVFIDRIKQLKKKGIEVPADANPVYYLEDRSYLGGKIKGWVESNVQPVYEALTENEINWTDFGEVMFYERIAAGDRSEQANPRGITPAAAKELLSYVKTKLGEQKWQILQDQLNALRDAVKVVATEAYNGGAKDSWGLYSEELYQQMIDNPAYATYRVLDHIEENVRAKVYRSVGTFKDIQNPADSTILKVIETIKAIERAKVNFTGVKFLQDYFKEDIKPAKTRWTGRVMEAVESNLPNEELVMYPAAGSYKGFYVDPYIAKTLRNETIDRNWALLNAIKFLNSRQFRPLFITFNTGFQAFNLIRDFVRFYKNVPGLSFVKAIALYAKAMPAAKARAFGSSNENANKIIQQMEREQILSVTFNDLIMGRGVEDKQIDEIMKRTGIETFAQSKKTRWFFKPFVALLDFIKDTGDLIETLPKVAGYYFLNGKMPPHEMRSFIRRNIGSPDFLDKGYATPVTNELFLFSNAIIQGFRSDAGIATNPKTRSGFWFKQAKVTLLPKLLMFAALLGLFGAKMKEMMESATEYDRTNYIIVPLGQDQNGQTTYIRVPIDETGRFISGIFWKVLTFGRHQQTAFNDFMDVISYAAGQAPNISPALTATGAVGQFITGQNPYDFFRGRNVLTDQQFQAGGMYKLKPFLLWMFNTLGGSVFLKTYSGTVAPTDKTLGQKVLEAPIISNVLGRFVRVTSYGQQETNRNTINFLNAKETAAKLDENKKINDAIVTYQKTKVEDANRMFVAENIYNQLVIDVIGHEPETSAEKTQANAIKKKFKVGMAKGINDPKVSAMVDAKTNEQKAIILQSFKDVMNEQDFKDYGNTLLEYGVISDQFVEDFKATDPQKLRDKMKAQESVSETGLIHTISLYAKAIGTDPLTAFDRIFTGEKIMRIANNAIITERMDVAKSEAVKQKLNAAPNMILDHTIPLELGGSNKEDNLKLVEESVWASYTPVENYLGKLLNEKKIKRQQAQQLIKDFKGGKITADEIYTNYK